MPSSQVKQPSLGKQMDLGLRAQVYWIGYVTCKPNVIRMDDQILSFIYDNK